MSGAMATAPRWNWAIEYLAELKELDFAALNELIYRIPNFLYAIPEGSRKRLYLRYLERSLAEREEDSRDPESNHLLESDLPKKYFDLIDESIRQGRFPESLSRHAEPLKVQNNMECGEELQLNNEKNAQEFGKPSEQPDNKSCHPPPGYLTEKGNEDSKNGGEVAITPMLGDGPIGDVVEDDASCIKCRKNGKMLICSFCYITVHEGCFVSEANLVEGCAFCCPWCSYRKSREEHDAAKEMWSCAREKLSRAKDALADFIESNAAAPLDPPIKETCRSKKLNRKKKKTRPVEENVCGNHQP